MRVRENIRSNFNKVKAVRTDAINHSAEVAKLKKALRKMWTYLDAEAVNKTPVQYDDIAKVFGKIDRATIQEVLSYAVSHRTQRRIKQALEDSKK